jgi:UDP-glucuronate 4-epimerase
MGLILVTGAAGFIGYHASHALLERGEEVIGLDNLNPYYDVALKMARLDRLAMNAGFRFLKADVADMPALKAALGSLSGDIDRVLHLAAQAGVRYSLEAPEAYVRSNLVGHFNVMQLAHEFPMLRHFVYASSSSVYGRSARVPFALGDPADRPASLYAATKRGAELMSASYADLHGMPQTGLRFFTVYGPWGRPDMAYFKFTRAVLAGQPIDLYNNGVMRRDFTYVDDAISGVLAALDRPPPEGGSRHRLYNLGNDRPEELASLVGAVERACERKAVINLLPMQAGDVEATWADISASKRDLGYAPRTGINEGIGRFVAWYRDFYRGTPGTQQ